MVIKLSITYKELYCKGEPYRSSSRKDLTIQTGYTGIKIYFLIRCNFNKSNQNVIMSMVDIFLQMPLYNNILILWN